MRKTVFQTVDEYIAAQPKDVQKALQRMRSIIRKAVPKAEEGVSYRIPCYKLHGKPVVFLAGWKEHCSLYAASGTALGAFREELAPYEISKGTIRFPLTKPVPAKLIEQIARFRAHEVEEKASKAIMPKARASKR